MTYRDSQFKPRFIMWYEEDFRADSYVQRMTPHQRAMYRNLILECYYGDDRPYLTTDDEKLWFLAGADSPSDWTDNKALIMAKFKPMPESGGTLLFNNRVLAEWDILIEKLAQKKNAGSASAEARRKRVSLNDKPESPVEEEKKDTTQHKSVQRPLNVRWKRTVRTKTVRTTLFCLPRRRTPGTR